MYIIYGREKREEIRKSYDFRKSNFYWNGWHFNSKTNIGGLMLLISKCNPCTYKQWKNYYFNSGKERLKLLKEKKKNDSLSPKEEKTINRNYGRTFSELIDISRDFYKVLKAKMPYFNSTLNDVVNYVFIRIIDETWTGYLREQKALSEIACALEKDNLTVAHTPDHIDCIYAVDLEVFDNEQLLAGIQIKSIYYKNTIDKDVLQINDKKNRSYLEKFKAPVLYAYLKEDKSIDNLSEIVDFFKEKK